MQRPKSGLRHQRLNCVCRKVRRAAEAHTLVSRLIVNIFHLNPRWSADLTELDLPESITLTHPDPSKKLDFEVVITPDEGKL